MRIISQNGKIDIPYESVILVEDNGSIFAYAAGLSLGRKIGTYDSTDKAVEILYQIGCLYRDGAKIVLLKEEAATKWA